MLGGGKRIYICVIVYLVYGTAKLPQKDELEWFYIGIRNGRGRKYGTKIFTLDNSFINLLN